MWSHRGERYIPIFRACSTDLLGSDLSWVQISTLLLTPAVTAAYSDQGMFLLQPTSAGLGNHVHQWFVAELGVAVQASKST